MKTMTSRLRAAVLVLLVAAVVACTPGGGGGASAPAASTGTAPSTAPISSGSPGAGY
jgi:hypothetical protein